MEGTVEIAEAITTVTGELVTKRELLPARQTEYDTKVEEKATVEEENEFYSSELIIVEEQNTRRRAAYEAQRDEHDALTAALEQARGIIR